MTLKDSLVSGTATPIANWAANSVLQRIQHVLDSNDLDRFEQEVMNHRFEPGDDEKSGLAEVGGLDKILMELEEEILHPMQYGHYLTAYSDLLGPTSGLLLYGPTGTGKSSIMRVLAYNVKGFALLNIPSGLIRRKWLGESEQIVEAMFSVAKRLQPCIIFVDEVDWLCGNRNPDEATHESSLKSALLAAWDGLSAAKADGTRDAILFAGATNRKEDLDPAFLRRFTVQKYIGLPNAVQRAEILKLLLEKTKKHKNFNHERLATRMEGFNGSLIKDSCRSAAAMAVSGKILSAIKQAAQEISDTSASENRHSKSMEYRLHEAVKEALDQTDGLTELNFEVDGVLRNYDQVRNTAGLRSGSKALTVKTLLNLIAIGIALFACLVGIAIAITIMKKDAEGSG